MTHERPRGLFGRLRSLIRGMLAIWVLENPEDPDNQLLYYRQLSEFTLVSSREVHFNLDGEPTQEKKLKFSVLPKHLGVAY